MKFFPLCQVLVFLLIMLQAKAQLTGEWSDEKGANYKIRQVNERVYWLKDNRPQQLCVFEGTKTGDIITGSWADMPGGSQQGSGTLTFRVENQNRMVVTNQTGKFVASVLTRGGPATASGARQAMRTDLTGTWYDYSPASGLKGSISNIKQTGEKLVFTNVFNNSSEGYFVDNENVVATGWEGGLTAKLENNGKKIVWKNGSVWERSLRPVASGRPNLAGTWYDYSPAFGINGAVTKIQQDGNKLVFTNSKNDVSEGFFIDNINIIASQWEGGLKASVQDNARRIVWKNGSVWQRSKK